MRPRSADPDASPWPEAATVDLSESRSGTSYLLIEPIGGGATGRVWRAVDRNTGDQVAVKLLHRDLMSEPKAVTRFVQERSILLMLRHQHIVRVRDMLTIGDSLGLVMDLVDGGSLRQYLRAHGTLAPATAADLLAQIAEALAEAHRLGVVHRDLKPDNVLIDGDPAAPQARLTDFGIARLLDSPGLTTPQALIGTPNYLAPEVITGGPPSPAMDVYALGVLLYELLWGRPPYGGGPPVVVLHRHLDGEPHRHPGVPEEAWRAVLACMAKDPEDRPSAAALVTTMRSLARSASSDPPAPAASGSPAASPRVAAAPPAAEQPPASPAGPGRVPPRRRLIRRWRPAAALLVGAIAVTLVATLGPGALPDWLVTALRREGPSQAAAGPLSGPPDASSSPAPAATAEPSPIPRAPTPGTDRHRPSDPHGRSPAPPPVRLTAQVYGPLRCTTAYKWDIGHPVVAKPCHAVGPGIELFGRLQALPGVQADVSLSLQDVGTGQTVAGPYTCPGLMFTDFAREHDCGPFQVTDARHGHRYVVVQHWAYTGRGILPYGTARGDPFRW